jgi:hypothetical protein
VRSAARAAALLSLLAALVPASAQALPDGRGYERVSPIDKNGGEIRGAGTVANGGVFQAAADGNSVTYSSTSSFATAAQSAPPGSQYLSARGAAGWSTENLNVPIFSGSYGVEPDGVPYRLFSADLARALLLNGRPCRAAEAACPIANPPLPGTDAPAGYQDYYLRSGAGFEALVGTGDVTNTALDPSAFTVRLAGASPDLTRVVLESCAALTPDAAEVPLGEGCDPNKANLYLFSAGSLTMINAAPGAELAAEAGAVSEGGSRVYFTDEAGSLWLREGTGSKLVFATSGEAPEFQTASTSGAIAYYSYAGILFRYDAVTESSTPLTDAFVLTGMLGSSPDGSYAYYQTSEGLFVYHGEIASRVSPAANAADPSNFPPASGSARVSADGTKLAFVSSASLTGYNNNDQKTGLPDAEVFLYDVTGKVLRCVSCRANGTRPIGPSTIPRATANGVLATATDSYKPRVLSSSGNRVFFDSEDSLVGPDVNKEPDVYEWVPFGGGCAKPTGCVELISSGRSEEGARFVDASASGDDAFFVTDGSLVAGDPGAFDLYDARVGGGFPEPQPPIPCLGDACQDLPSEPVDPALNTLVPGPGNPKLRYFRYRRHDRGCRGAAAKKSSKCKGKKHGKGKSSKRGAPR